MDKIHNFAHSVFRRLSTECHDFQYDRVEPKEVTLLALYGTCLELYAAIIVLSEKNHYAAIPGILRELSEAAVGLINLSTSADYYKHLVYTHTNKNIQRLQAAHDRHDSEFAAAFGDIISLKDTLRILRKRAGDLKAAGAKAIEPGMIYENAGMQDIHKTVYSMLSSYSHHDIERLAEKHLVEIDVEQVDLVIFSEWPLANKLFLIDSAIGSILSAAEHANRFFNNDPSHTSRLLEEFESLRDEYPAPVV